MDSETFRLICGILAVVFLACYLLKRRSRVLQGKQSDMLSAEEVKRRLEG